MRPRCSAQPCGTCRPGCAQPRRPALVAVHEDDVGSAHCRAAASSMRDVSDGFIDGAEVFADQHPVAVADQAGGELGRPGARCGQHQHLG